MGRSSDQSWTRKESYFIMIILKMNDGEILKFNFSDSQKEKDFFEFWKKFTNKKIKLKTENEESEIKLIDIEECLIEEDAKNFLKEEDLTSENMFDNTSFDFLKNMFKI